MFRGPSFIVNTMQEETTPIFKRLWYDWAQQQPGIEPTNPLGQCLVPPIVAFYDQHGLLRTYSLPGGSIRSPHPGSPRGRVGTRVGTMHVSSVLCHSCTAKAEDQSATTTQVDAPDREGEAHKDVRKRKSPKSVHAEGRGHSVDARRGTGKTRVWQKTKVRSILIIW